jgi:hypothetical protein
MTAPYSGHSQLTGKQRGSGGRPCETLDDSSYYERTLIKEINAILPSDDLEG